MKVLFFCDYSGNLGDATRITKNYELIRNLHEGTVICNLYDHYRSKVRLLTKPLFLHWALRSFVKENRANFISEIYFSMGERVLATLIRKMKPDVIFAEKETLAYVAVLNRDKIPVVADLHGIWSAEYEERPDRRVSKRQLAAICEIEEEIYDTAHQVLVVSNNMKSYLLERNKIDENKVTVVQNGADLHGLCASYRDHMKCIYGGMFTFWEDVDTYLNMAREDSVNEYYLIGTGPLRDHVLKRIERESIKVSYFGHKSRKESLDLFARMTIGIAPSSKNITRYVASPVKVYDYMACGLPVITPNYGEWSKHVEENDSGFVTQSSNAEEFLAALDELSDRNTWERKSENGRNAIRTKYNWDTVLAPIKDVLS